MNLRKKLSSFRKKNKIGAHHVDKYHTEEITLPSGERRKILRRIKKGSVGRIVLSQERIFDASKSGMTTAVVTLGKSEPGCYVVLCPGCLQKNPTIKPHKGSRVSLRSRQFREQFQVDLIICKFTILAKANFCNSRPSEFCQNSEFCQMPD